jgi:hypothetical protein
MPAASFQLRRNRRRKPARLAFHHFRIVFPQSLNEPLVTGADGHFTPPHIVARDLQVRFVSLPSRRNGIPRSGPPIDRPGSGTNPFQNLFAAISHSAHRALAPSL